MQLFALFGNPLAHSISARLHNFAFENLGVDAAYIKILAQNSNEIKAKFNALCLSGANITLPFKETSLEICDEISANAKKIGSINTIFSKNGKIYGFNTDAPGFLMSIKPFGKINKALIIGAGGTAKAISYILSKSNINVQIINRSAKRLENFSNFTTFTWENFRPNAYDIVINTTSAGLNDENLPLQKDLLFSTLKQAKFAFDVIYGKQTPFLKMAKQLNLAHKNGAQMLLFQAILAFDIFTQKQFSQDKIQNLMQKALML